MKHFSFKEMIKSDTAKTKGIDNIPDWDEINALQTLIEAVLEPLREWYDKPIYITSGYRCKALNEAVGGVPTSLHAVGSACDINQGSKTENEKIFNYIKDNLPFTELGWEGNGKWIHVAYVKDRDEKEVFYA